MNKILVTFGIIAILSACSTSIPQQHVIGMPNPASEYCIKQGGKLEIRKNSDGEYGLCHLLNGSTIEEWELFRSNHK